MLLEGDEAEGEEPLGVVHIAVGGAHFLAWPVGSVCNEHDLGKTPDGVETTQPPDKSWSPRNYEAEDIKKFMTAAGDRRECRPSTTDLQ